MIPVTEAQEPPSFEAWVRQRGADAVKRLLGQPVNKPGRNPKQTYARLEDIPTEKFPALWTERRPSDDRSTLDDMMDRYEQCCAYLAMRLERATGSPTVDHYIPQATDRTLIYEWSNYRLSASCVNAAKGTKELVDPFKVEPGWFELDLDTFLVRRGQAAPPSEHARIDRTLELLNLRPCVQQRGEFITRYRNNQIDLKNIAFYAPFIERELRRQGKLLRGEP